ncbi:hypothetical protein [Sinomonas sp. G460-2]|uniref:hypothetical protein n=1 Tax=Sinomonas sp. G460-2 TaxID=3393464 RepID=UPI0039F0D86D
MSEGGLFAQGEAFNKVGVELYRLLSPGDERIVLSASSLVSVLQGQILAVNPTGQYATPEGRVNAVTGSEALFLAVRELRETSYQEGLGTWYGLRVEVTPSGGATADYNYDDEPTWDPPVDPEAYVLDQRTFPRDEDERPDWLVERLAQGGFETAQG